MKINENYKNLSESYLFSTIAKKVAVYTQQHPEQEIIRLGIGDVTLPLAAPVVDALHAAVEEMGKKETFHGYGPEQGYGFLKQALMRYYARRGVVLAENEIFVGDGAKSDIGNILDLFDVDNTVLVPDPVYPVYVDTNVMAGRRIVYAAATRENGFLPMPQADVQADLIYLCSPNNPTGAAYSRDQLQAWVDYANERGAVLLFDAAYESFITDGDVPHSIYEVNGAETCAIEFCSFSKTAGFTGTRCSYTVVPQALVRGQPAPQCHVAAPPDHEIQRRTVHCAAGGCGRVHGGGAKSHQSSHRLLPGQCCRHRGRAGRGRHMVLRRQKQPLYLDAVPRRHEVLGFLRSSAGACGRCGYAGRGLWRTG